MLLNKIKTLGYSLLGLSILIMPFAVKAISFNFDRDGTLKNQTGLGNQDPIVVAGYLVNWLLSLLGLCALLLIIYGGFKWMFARGNEEDVKKAKDILTAAVVGLAIILSSYGISSYVFNRILSMTIE